jgi:DNA-binding transcriptional ArsR family regulator
MVSHDTRLDSIFHALADPTRRAMLRSLASKNQSIGELAVPFTMTFPAASKHLRVLESAGLVSRTVRGRVHEFQIAAAPLAEADRWLHFYERLWNQQFDTLEALLEAQDSAKIHRSKRKRRKIKS